MVLALAGEAVADPEAWERVEAAVAARRARGQRCLVVADALPGVGPQLDRLAGDAVFDRHAPALQAIAARHLALARALGVDAAAAAGTELGQLSRLALGITLDGEVTPRVRARLRALGPTLLTRVVAAWWRERRPELAAVDARELLRVGALADPGAALDVVPRGDPDPELVARLDHLEVVLTEAGVGGDFGGEPVAVGRSAPERAAVALAARLGADTVVARLDRPPLHTADPARVAGARPVTALDPDTALALARLGGWLDPAAVALAGAAGVVLELEGPGDHPGTRVAAADPDGAPVRAPPVLVAREGLYAVRPALAPAAAFTRLAEHPVRPFATLAAGGPLTLVLAPVGAPLDDDERATLADDLGERGQPAAVVPVSLLLLVGGALAPALAALPAPPLATVDAGGGVAALVLPPAGLDPALAAVHAALVDR